MKNGWYQITRFKSKDLAKARREGRRAKTEISLAHWVEGERTACSPTILRRALRLRTAPPRAEKCRNCLDRLGVKARARELEGPLDVRDPVSIPSSDSLGARGGRRGRGRKGHG